jgi:hypothetical protein
MSGNIVSALNLNEEVIGSNDSDILKLSCRRLIGTGSETNSTIYVTSGSDAGLLNS